MESRTRVVKDFESLFSEVVDEINTTTEESFAAEIEYLTDTGFLVRLTELDDDRILYTGRADLEWKDYVHLDSPLKKLILGKLVPNSKTFFVLYNTQKGKMRIAALQVKSWALKGKPVVFLAVDNDRGLADQTRDGLISEIEDVAEVFVLSSNSKHTFEMIKTYIDAYASDQDSEYKMPTIVFLPTPQQITKVLKLANHIQKKVSEKNSMLRTGIIFDEADKVYPPMRDRFLPIINGSALEHLGFVTATDGDLMDEDYPECANAQMFQPGEGDPNYRAFHHEDAIIKTVPHKSKDGNDSYAEKILNDPLNRDHIYEKITLRSGETAFRKFIVNGPVKTEHMRDFANKRVADGCNAITVNMYGIKVYTPGNDVETHSFKGKKFNKALFDIYNKLNLGSAPLFIIGRRKVDRGVGFHYAPRPSDDNPVPPPGLIWTDMILGRIPDKDTAVQKAGRLAGIIAGSQQYSGNICYWTDESTAAAIRKHNKTVDVANKQPGCSALQATTRAKAEISRLQANEGLPTEPKNNKVRSYALSDTFETVSAAKHWGKDHLDYPVSEYKIHILECRDSHCRGCWSLPSDKFFKYRGMLRKLMSEKEVRSSFDPAEEGTAKHGRIIPVNVVGGDVNTEARILPVVDLGYSVADKARAIPINDIDGEALRYIVIYTISKLKKIA